MIILLPYWTKIMITDIFSEKLGQFMTPWYLVGVEVKWLTF